MRTTSLTYPHSPVTPYIQRGLALAVAPDVMTKAHHRFDLASAERLPKPELAEMRKVAIALANHLGLGRFTGLLSRGTG